MTATELKSEDLVPPEEVHERCLVLADSIYRLCQQEDPAIAILACGLSIGTVATKTPSHGVLTAAATAMLMSNVQNCQQLTPAITGSLKTANEKKPTPTLKHVIGDYLKIPKSQDCQRQAASAEGGEKQTKH